MNLTAKQFDADNARACAQVSADAYRQATLTCAATDTQVLIAELPDCLIVGFRGSSALEDFIIDARFFRSLLLEEADGSRCEVHSGFLAAYESIIGPLSSRLGGSPVFKYQNCKPLFVTGHSLGGALAILAAVELKRQGFAIAQVYTFGQPRVGNKAFAAMYNYALKDSTFALVNEGDPVPLLPPLLNGYRDCGTEIWLRKSGGTLVDPFIGFELFTDIMGAISSWRNYRLGLLPNHFLAAYRTRLSAINSPTIN